MMFQHCVSFNEKLPTSQSKLVKALVPIEGHIDFDTIYYHAIETCGSIYEARAVISQLVERHILAEVPGGFRFKSLYERLSSIPAGDLYLELTKKNIDFSLRLVEICDDYRTERWYEETNQVMLGILKDDTVSVYQVGDHMIIIDDGIYFPHPDYTRYPCRLGNVNEINKWISEFVVKK